MNIIIMDTSEQWHNVYDCILTVVGGAEFTSASFSCFAVHTRCLRDENQRNFCPTCLLLILLVSHGSTDNLF